MPLAPGMQVTRVQQLTRTAFCSRDTCLWFRDGAEGMSENEPYRHPAGVQCGDTTRCKPCVNGPAAARCGRCDPCRAGTANCPCPERLPHIVLEDRDPLFYVNTGFGTRQVVPDEWLTRTYEGVDAIQHIRTRGL